MIELLEILIKIGCLFVVGLSGGGSGGSVRVVERGREVGERRVLQLAGKPVRSEQWMVFKRGGDDRGFVGYPFNYRKTQGFGSIAGGLDHVNHVIRLSLERGISRVQGLGDHPNPSEVSMVKLNAQCSAILQNELPPKEKDPGSFILPCAIGTTTVSNASADLGANISIMPFSLFKWLGLGNPKLINMVIEKADRSMQSPKGIFEKCAGSARLNDDFSGTFCNPNSNSSISMDDFVEMDDVWDNLDFRDLANEATKFPVKPEFLSSSNRIRLHSPYNLQITCKIGFVNFDPYIESQSPFNIMS
nr:hypothetical protein [Tanacetum cinerariifolium]